MRAITNETAVQGMSSTEVKERLDKGSGHVRIMQNLGDQIETEIFQ
jgi:hypothetical protein